MGDLDFFGSLHNSHEICLMAHPLTSLRYLFKLHLQEPFTDLPVSKKLSGYSNCPVFFQYHTHYFLVPYLSLWLDYKLSEGRDFIYLVHCSISGM